MRAKNAGFDAIMIHGGHGYLVPEFLSSRINLRQDEYGGDIKGRARFALELVGIAKEMAKEDCPIIFRLSASERLEDGFALKEAIEVCKLLQNAGVDAIDVVSGAAETTEWVVPYMIFPHGYNVEFAEEIKKAMNSSINELFGIVGLSRIKPKIIEFDQKMQRGIIRCNHSHLREIRAALTLINNISGIELAIHVERISGTLKSIRNFSRSNSNLRK